MPDLSWEGPTDEEMEALRHPPGEVEYIDPITGRIMLTTEKRAGARDEQAQYLRWLLSIIELDPARVRKALGLVVDDEGYYHDGR